MYEVMCISMFLFRICMTMAYGFRLLNLHYLLTYEPHFSNLLFSVAVGKSSNKNRLWALQKGMDAYSDLETSLKAEKVSMQLKIFIIYFVPAC